jgi:hypothetical protein
MERSVRGFYARRVLSGAPLRLAYIAGLGFLALGAVLFFAPEWSAGRFAWGVSPFLAMTIGGWCLGTAAFAFQTARVRRWAETRATAAYLYLFSCFQALVLAVHAGDLDFGQALAVPYVTAIAIGVVAAVAGIASYMRTNANQRLARAPVWLIVLVLGFSLFVAALAVPLLDGYDNPASIWPGELGLASARSFAAFFGALSLSAAVLAFGRSLRPMATYAQAGIALNVPILAAAIVYLDRFDFRDHPGQYLYVGLYVLVPLAALGIIAFARGAETPTQPVRARSGSPQVDSKAAARSRARSR